MKALAGLQMVILSMVKRAALSGVFGQKCSSAVEIAVVPIGKIMAAAASVFALAGITLKPLLQIWAHILAKAGHWTGLIMMGIMNYLIAGGLRERHKIVISAELFCQPILQKKFERDIFRE